MPCKINSVQCDFLPLVDPRLQVSSLAVQGFGAVGARCCPPDSRVWGCSCCSGSVSRRGHSTACTVPKSDFQTFPASVAVPECFLLPLISRVGAQILSAILLLLMMFPQYRNCSRINDSFQQRVMSVTLQDYIIWLFLQNFPHFKNIIFALTQQKRMVLWFFYQL